MRRLKTILASAFLIAFCTFALLSDSRAEQAQPSSAAQLQPAHERFASLQKAEDPSFRRHVVPLLARQGCSSRECHGSFQGRGGFQLSLFGSEWDHDFVQLTKSKGDEDETHVDLEKPEQSLILLKPTLQVKHKGKERFKKDSWQYNIILKWVQDGAVNDAEKTGELAKLEITPNEMVFNQIGQQVQLRVLAHWTNGLVEDVTDLTRFKTNDETVATVSENGVVACVGKGDSDIVASYDNGVVPIPVMLPVSQFAGEHFPSVATRTKVDELVVNKLRKMGIVPSEVCTDAEFLRRVSLDVTGTLPTPDDVQKFVADPSPNKRSAKINQLLETPAYAAWWTTKFCDYTGDSPRELNVGGNINRNPGEIARQWYDWVYKRVADNVPYDKFVEEIVLSASRTSSDQTYEQYALEMDSYFRNDNPATYADHPTLPYFWQRRNVQLPQEKALAFSHAFLGVRLECAQCHKHPFDRWTKTDFAQFTAFFNTINANPQPTAKGDDGISYQSLTRDLRDKATAEVESQEPVVDESVLTESSDKDAASTDAKAVDSKDDKGAVAKGPETRPSNAKVQPKVVDASTKIQKGQIHPEFVRGLDGKLRRFDPREQQKIQKRLQDMVKERIDANQPVPWAELWVNSRGLPQRTKKQGTVDPNATPKVLGGEEVDLHDFKDPRQPLMDWLRSKGNPYFAKAFVNRVWASYFSRGIVNPPDDMNLANAPCNAELLNYLAEGFVSHGYDMKWLHREILNSDTYQRSWKTNPTNELDIRNFSHEVVRQLPAEVMADAINMAIGPDDQLNTFETQIGSRAIGPDATAQYAGKGGKVRGGGPGPDSYFLTLFGKPTRETNCDCERSEDPTLLQTLFTRNDPNLLSRIEGFAGPNTSWVAGLRKTYANPKTAPKMDVDGLITQVFLRTVSRIPTTTEMDEARSDVSSQKNPVDGIRDLLWAMVNTREFRVNH